MKHLCRLSALLSFALLLSLVSRTASAQITWPVNSIFHGQIHEVKFLDVFPGNGKIGFVCDDTGLSRTNDNGTTWVRCTIVNTGNPLHPLPTGYINDLTFSDAVHGFAILDSVIAPGWSHHGVLISSDSGITWNFDDTSGTPYSGDGIYYNTSNGRLFVASDDSGIGLTVSTNQGKTWKTIDTNTYYTGFSFTSNLNGVVATEGTICANSIFHNWLITADGGLTWTKARMYIQSWQPFGIPTTERYFGASNNDCLVPTANEILVSDNGGNTFTPVAGYTPLGDMLNESMAGDGCMIFAASSVQVNGMWFSRNDGANFVAMIGSPNPPIDTRFYVSPTLVWSFTSDTLYNNPRPATSDIHVWPLSINIKNAECNTTVDTVIHVFGCNCSNSITLTGDSIQRVSADTQTQVSVLPTFPPPISLCSGGFGVADSVSLLVQAKGGLPDTFNVHLLFNDNGTTVDTAAKAEVNGLSPDLEAVGNPSTINITTPACNTVDTFIDFQNTSCDAITITRALISENTQDECQLQLLGQFDFTSSNITIDPGTPPYRFHVRYESGLRKACTSGGAGLQLEWHGSDGKVHDTKIIIINACTSTDLRPTYRGLNIDSTNCCTMPSFESVIVFNTTCDTITLLKPTFTRGSTCNHFKLAANHYPLSLPPETFSTIYHDVDSVLIDCSGSACHDTIQYVYQISTTFDSINSPEQSLCASTVFDTINIPISMAPATPIPPTTVSPSSLNFANVSCCDSTQVKAVTITAPCKADTITKIVLDSSGNGNFYFDPSPPSLPIDLAAGGSFTFQVGYRPRCDENPNGNPGSETGSVKATTSRFGALTGLQLRATSTNAAAEGFSSDTLDFGSVLSCGDTCLTINIANNSCGQIKTSLLTPASLSCFSAPTFGTDTLNEGGSGTMTVCLNPSQCNNTGDILDSLSVQASSIDGKNGTSYTRYLKAHIIPAVLGYTLTPIADTTICDSTTADETFTLTDTATCYTLGVTSINGGNGRVTVTPQTATLTKGQQQIFTAHFAPTQLGNITGPIVLTLADGSTISVPYNFTSKSCGATGTAFIVINPDTITVPNCTSGPIIITASANGGGSGTVESLSVSGSGRFSVTGPSSGAFPYSGTITFDPNQPGTNVASANLTYTFNNIPGDTTFNVYGVVNGVKDSTRVGVINMTNNCIKADGTQIDTLAVVLRDPIPPNTGFDTLSFDITYDGNLLWGAQSIASSLPAGWSVGSITSTATGLHVILVYSGTSGFAANTTLVQIQQWGAVADSLSTTATITNVHFNDSAFEACSMKALSSTGDIANICVDTTFCGGGPIYYALHNALSQVSGIAIIPNPIHKSESGATLHFTTLVDGKVTAELLDQLGRSAGTLNSGPLPAGDHDLSIPTERMAEGTYFARITLNGRTVIRQFVLEKE